MLLDSSSILYACNPGMQLDLEYHGDIRAACSAVAHQNDSFDADNAALDHHRLPLYDKKTSGKDGPSKGPSESNPEMLLVIHHKQAFLKP
mmetsp:Transcript_2007/g.3088  ORF Transcript_2007/g.3088 Transcript_2007/m.3088 type:complete len:90 (+) Transcript_2007:122-391(+)